MKCPKCGRIQRLTKKEKAITMEKGEYKFWCMTCGAEMIAHRYDVDVAEMRKHNREIGICFNCGCRPATEGFSTCAHCREYYISGIVSRIAKRRNRNTKSKS